MKNSKIRTSFAVDFYVLQVTKILKFYHINATQ